MYFLPWKQQQDTSRSFKKIQLSFPQQKTRQRQFHLKQAHLKTSVAILSVAETTVKTYCKMLPPNSYLPSFLLIVTTICIIQQQSSATLSEGDRATKSPSVIEKSKPCNQSLQERGLITKTPKIKDVIRENEAYTIYEASIKKFNGSNLAYVTPWNPKGYEIAEKFAAKFSHLSPVWLQLKIDHENEEVRLEGTQDIDYQWMKRVRHANPEIKIVPRVILDQWTQLEIQHLLENNKMPSSVGRLLVDSAKKYDFNGYVLEAWNTFAIYQHEQVAHMISKIYAHFKKHKLQLILVVPPPMRYG